MSFTSSLIRIDHFWWTILDNLTQNIIFKGDIFDATCFCHKTKIQEKIHCGMFAKSIKLNETNTKFPSALNPSSKSKIMYWNFHTSPKFVGIMWHPVGEKRRFEFHKSSTKHKWLTTIFFGFSPTSRENESKRNKAHLGWCPGVKRGTQHQFKDLCMISGNFLHPKKCVKSVEGAAAASTLKELRCLALAAKMDSKRPSWSGLWTQRLEWKKGRRNYVEWKWEYQVLDVF